MANPNAFGSFAEGITRGVEFAQDSRTRYERNQLLKEDREDRTAYKGAVGALGDINATGGVGPEGNLVSKPGADVLGDAYNRINNILDPKRREQYLQAYAAKVSQIAAQPLMDAASAIQAGDSERAMAALAPINNLTGAGSMFSFSVNDKGEVVNGSGTKVMPQHLTAALQFLQNNPEAAFGSIFAGDKAALEADLAERGIATKEETNELRAALNEIYQNHYERADAIDLLDALNDARALTGQSPLKPVDIDRLHKATDKAIENDQLAFGIAAVDSAGFRGLAKAIVDLNSGAGNALRPDDAVKLATDLYMRMHGEKMPDDIVELAGDSQREGVIQEARDADGNPTGTYVVSYDSGEQILIPDIYVNDYLSAQQAANQPPPPEEDRSPALPTEPRPSGPTRRAQRSALSTLDPLEFLKGKGLLPEEPSTSGQGRR